MVTKVKREITVPQFIDELARRFLESGHRLYIVGGSVRDACMGRCSKDYDVASFMLPDQVARVLSEIPGCKVLDIGKAFGVIKVIAPDGGGEFEIATFRRDVGTGRRPSAVEFADINVDVQRRDLTMNALYYDPIEHEIIDIVGGFDDISHGTVRFVEDAAARIAEDPLRILRAVRFASWPGMELHDTATMVLENYHVLDGCSNERIREEFLKGISSARSTPRYVGMLSKFGLLDRVFPGLEVNCDDVIESRDAVVVLATLLRSNFIDDVDRALHEMKYTSSEIKQTIFLLRFAKIDCNSAPTLKRLAFRVDRQKIREFAAFTKMGKWLVDAFMEFLDEECPMTAAELLSNGLDGQSIGIALFLNEQHQFEAIRDRRYRKHLSSILDK